MAYNGPAIWGGCVTRRSIRARICPGRPVSCPGARRVRRSFCHHGINFIAIWRDRGISMMRANYLSPVTNFMCCTGAVSRYKLSRRHKFITVQNLNCEQMSVSGCNNYYRAILSAGAKAKTVTNNLPILSVL